MKNELSRKAYLCKETAHSVTKMHPPAYFYFLELFLHILWGLRSYF